MPILDVLYISNSIILFNRSSLSCFCSLLNTFTIKFDGVTFISFNVLTNLFQRLHSFLQLVAEITIIFTACSVNLRSWYRLLCFSCPSPCNTARFISLSHPFVVHYYHSYCCCFSLDNCRLSFFFSSGTVRRKLVNKGIHLTWCACFLHRSYIKRRPCHSSTKYATKVHLHILFIYFALGTYVEFVLAFMVIF